MPSSPLNCQPDDSPTQPPPEEDTAATVPPLELGGMDLGELLLKEARQIVNTPPPMRRLGPEE